MNRVMPAEFAQAQIANDAKVLCEHATIGDGAVIGPGVVIEAREVHIGPGTVIERGTTIRGLGRECDRVYLGDQSFIGFGNQILVPDFMMGDYAQLHNNSLTSGYKPIRIGHNCWVGQQSILNCTERLEIGNNVRIGTGSHIWTHVASGELLEGCTLFGEHPVTIEDNVWIVGGAVVSPGLRLGHHSIIMTGSVLTKSAEPFHTYAGVPAKDVTDKLNFWMPLKVEEQVAMVRKFAAEFRQFDPVNGARVHVMERAQAGRASAGDVLIAAIVDDWEFARETGVSLFELRSKLYLKQRTPAEIAWLRFNVGYRARFLPLEI